HPVQLGCFPLHLPVTGAKARSQQHRGVSSGQCWAGQRPCKTVEQTAPNRAFAVGLGTCNPPPHLFLESGRQAAVHLPSAQDRVERLVRVLGCIVVFHVQCRCGSWWPATRNQSASANRLAALVLTGLFWPDYLSGAI